MSFQGHVDPRWGNPAEPRAHEADYRCVRSRRAMWCDASVLAGRVGSVRAWRRVNSALPRALERGRLRARVEAGTVELWETEHGQSAPCARGGGCGRRDGRGRLRARVEAGFTVRVGSVMERSAPCARGGGLSGECPGRGS